MTVRRQTVGVVSKLQDDWMDLADAAHAARRYLDLARREFSQALMGCVDRLSCARLVAEIDQTIDERMQCYHDLPWVIEAAENLKQQLKTQLGQRRKMSLQ